jgi:hypothetical protein
VFGVGKTRLLAGLDRVRVRLCEYGGSLSCDCKYGAAGGGSEQSGCPEVSVAEALIAVMTPEEFASLCSRARVNVVELPENSG